MRPLFLHHHGAYSVCTQLRRVCVLRALYGIGMGGYWGIGASLVMESSPRRWRGLFSGIMQAGYSLGYLLAAVALRTIEPRFGWRWMFLCGLALAAVIAVLTLMSPESSSWQKNRLASFGEVFRILWQHKKDFVYLVLLMTAMTCLSHGTQDLYPDFLKTVHRYSNDVISNLAILYNIGAIAGALVIGISLTGLAGATPSCWLWSSLRSPSRLWAFGSTMIMLAVGSFMMQFGVQGAFGVIPAHLNELSPASVRSLFPGVVYQLGVLLARRRWWWSSPCAAFRLSMGAYALRDVCDFCLFLIFGFGPERRGHDFHAAIRMPKGLDEASATWTLPPLSGWYRRIPIVMRGCTLISVGLAGGIAGAPSTP